jgi:hypothetical protein
VAHSLTRTGGQADKQGPPIPWTQTVQDHHSRWRRLGKGYQFVRERWVIPSQFGV